MCPLNPPTCLCPLWIVVRADAVGVAFVLLSYRSRIIEHVSERQALPVDLAQMRPGPGLAALLATVDRSRLGAADLYELVRARARQVAHDQAQLLADVFEAGLAAHQDEDTLRRHPDLVERAEVQVAWTLHCSDSHAQTQILLGRALRRRLPMVWQALADGRLDYHRAAAFADCLADLDQPTARVVAARW